MQFLGNFGKIVCSHPPGELAPPPWGNPGSATDPDSINCTYLQLANMLFLESPAGVGFSFALDGNYTTNDDLVS